MPKNASKFYLENFKYDFSSGIVVFLVALPLCLGIALASGADLFTGIISGIVGGIIVGLLSGSQLAVSGPAAGLAVIVLDGITKLENYNLFLTALVLAGILQLIFGFLKAGFIANFFPSSVIKGMLAAIGVILILKQVPHILGDDLDYIGNLDFLQWDHKNTFSEILLAFKKMNPAAIGIGLISLAVLLCWPLTPLNKIKILPAPLIVVVLGIVLNKFAQTVYLGKALGEEHLVHIPISRNVDQFLSNFKFPDFSGFLNPDVIVVGCTLAIVASLETLLSIEAIDKLDPMKRVSPTNRELKAQGFGNLVAGLIGGLPITAVIVRGSANVAAGAKTKVSTVIHGILLLVCLIAIPGYLNMIPLASLAAVLLLVGYKLTNLSLIKEMIQKGQEHFVPFFVTIAAIVFTDLLKGIAIGMFVAVYYILKRNYKNPYRLIKDGGENKFKIILSSEISFLNKSVLKNLLESFPKESELGIDATQTYYIDDDILEIFEDFKTQADYKKIKLTYVGFKTSYAKGQPHHLDEDS